MEHSQRRVLLFGLPGAGKTCLINRVISERDSFVKLSGGSLICDFDSSADRDFLRNEPSRRIILNQEKMCSNYWVACRRNSDKHIIFDGHLVVYNDSEDVKIPFSVIETLEPHALVFLDTPIEKIEIRRQADQIRPNRKVDKLDEIESIRQVQLSLFQEYSHRLSAPSITLESEPQENLVLFLDRVCPLPSGEA